MSIYNWVFIQLATNKIIENDRSKRKSVFTMEPCLFNQMCYTVPNIKFNIFTSFF